MRKDCRWPRTGDVIRCKAFARCKQDLDYDNFPERKPLDKGPLKLIYEWGDKGVFTAKKDGVDQQFDYSTVDPTRSDARFLVLSTTAEGTVESGPGGNGCLGYRETHAVPFGMLIQRLDGDGEQLRERISVSLNRDGGSSLRVGEIRYTEQVSVPQAERDVLEAIKAAPLVDGMRLLLDYAGKR